MHFLSLLRVVMPLVWIVSCQIPAQRLKVGATMGYCPGFESVQKGFISRLLIKMRTVH